MFQVMRDHGPVHLGDVDHAISKFTAEMRQHGAPWQVEGGTRVVEGVLFEGNMVMVRN